MDTHSSSRSGKWTHASVDISRTEKSWMDLSGICSFGSRAIFQVTKSSLCMIVLGTMFPFMKCIFRHLFHFANCVPSLCWFSGRGSCYHLHPMYRRPRCRSIADLGENSSAVNCEELLEIIRWCDNSRCFIRCTRRRSYSSPVCHRSLVFGLVSFCIFRVNHKLADVGPDAPNPYLTRSKEERDPPDEAEQQEIDTVDKK